MEENKKFINKESEFKELSYPVKLEGCTAQVFINGYLVKTAYSIQDDPEAFIRKIKYQKDSKVEELEVCIKLINGNLSKEIVIVGLMRKVLIEAWEEIEKKGGD